MLRHDNREQGPQRRAGRARAQLPRRLPAPAQAAARRRRLGLLPPRQVNPGVDLRGGHGPFHAREGRASRTDWRLLARVLLPHPIVVNVGNVGKGKTRFSRAFFLSRRAASRKSAGSGLPGRPSFPDMQISRIRLSDKTSRLRPRHVVPKPAQADEPEVPVEILFRAARQSLRRLQP